MKGMVQMKKQATIFDFGRFCRENKCETCPLGTVELCEFSLMNKAELEYASDIILEWCKEHPTKTRQNEFLKHYPNTRLVNNVIYICPQAMEKNYKCTLSCDDCRKSYWLEEVIK